VVSLSLHAAAARGTTFSRKVPCQTRVAAWYSSGKSAQLATQVAFSARGVGLGRGALSIVSMAHPKRVARVQQQIKREISTLFLQDKVLRGAIYPREAQGSDFALSSLASVTDLELSNDLQVAKVYVSVYADDAKKEETMEALWKLEGYTRKMIGKRVRLRLTPEIRFIMDDSYVRATKVLSVLEKLAVEREARAGKTVQSSAIDVPPEYADYVDGEDDDDDDEDKEAKNVIVVT